MSPHPPPPLPVTTERLVLRRREPGGPGDPGDLEALHDLYRREDVTRHLLHGPLSRRELEAHLAALAEGEVEGLALLVELDGRVVGRVSLELHAPHQGDLGWAVHPDVTGRGIATEAARALLDLGFGHYRLHRVRAELDARNHASRRVCERLGMRHEGHRLQDLWSKGEWTDTDEYAVLASEWRARH